MKWLNQISIKVKVMLPICILGIVILLASISSLVNSKRLLQAGVDEVLVKYDGGTRFVSGPRHETDNLCSP